MSTIVCCHVNKVETMAAEKTKYGVLFCCCSVLLDIYITIIFFVLYFYNFVIFFKRFLYVNICTFYALFLLLF